MASLTIAHLSPYYAGKNSGNYSTFSPQINALNFKPNFKYAKLTCPPPSHFQRPAMKPAKKVRKTVVAVLPNISKFVSNLKNALHTIKTIHEEYGWVLELINNDSQAIKELKSLFDTLKKFLINMGKKVKESLKFLINMGKKVKESLVKVKDTKGDGVGKESSCSKD